MKNEKKEWTVIYHSGICTGVGFKQKTDNGIYTEMVCNSLLPDTDEEYEKEKQGIEADMKLIAAAPDLLEAAIKACHAIKSEVNPSGVQMNAVFELEKAIKKTEKL